VITPIALPSTTITIDDEIYTIQTLDAITCFGLYSKLLNAVGGSLSSLSELAVKDNVESDKAAQLDLALRAIGALLRGLPPPLLEECRSVFANSSRVQKEAANPQLSKIFAFHFAGRMAHMSKWMFECAKVNFADFLDGDLVAQLSAKFKAHLGPSQSPTTSNGSTSE
jgi:tail assembly chaperone